MAPARRRGVGGRAKAPLLGATALLCAWALFYPVPYSLCIALLGFGALAALSLPRLTNGYVRVEAKNGGLDAAGQAVLCLSILLALRGLTDTDMIDWQWPLVLAGACGLLFVGLGVTADPPAIRNRSRRWRDVVNVAAPFFLGGAGFGWGSVVEANMLLDRSPPAVHALRVTGKWVTHGRGTRWHLALAAPNALGLHNVHVGNWLYARTPIGQLVCVHSQSGALGFRWYWVEACPNAGAA